MNLSRNKVAKIPSRVYKSFVRCLKPAYKSIRWLLTLMIPVSFGVFLLDYSGALFFLSKYTEPLVQLIGLRGESALVLLSGALLNIYSAVAVIQSIDFSVREITILGLMCLIAHNLIIESAVQKKTGSSALRMVLLRISMAILAGFILNLILPGEAIVSNSVVLNHEQLPFLETFTKWSIDTFLLIVKVITIVTLLNFLHKLLDEFLIATWLAKFMSPILGFFGLPHQSSFMWIIANVIGLGWGSTILIEEAEQGRISQLECDILNHHIAISHSLLEDTLLFVAVGAITFWIIFPRLVLAFIVVWIYRFFNKKKLQQNSLHNVPLS